MFSNLSLMTRIGVLSLSPLPDQDYRSYSTLHSDLQTLKMKLSHNPHEKSLYNSVLTPIVAE